MIIVIYIYAILGYLFLAETFEVGNYPDPELPACTSLWMCFVVAIAEGLRAGDIGAIMDPRESHDIAVEWDGLYYFQVVYQLTFWFIVITILLNVIFGIIIDSFGELRNNNLAIKHHMEARRAGTCVLSSAFATQPSPSLPFPRLPHHATPVVPSELLLRVRRRPIHPRHQGRRLRAPHQEAPPHVGLTPLIPHDLHDLP